MCLTKSRRAFTIIEIIVIFGVITALLALSLPILARAQEQARRTTCVSNLRQLGMALLAYTIDYDERLPSSALEISTSSFTNIAWAGQIYPHVKNAGIFRCPDESSSSQSTSNGILFPESYGLNANLAAASALANFTSPARTVLLFEVSDDHALLTDVSEGQHRQPQVSASGNGSNGGLANLTGAGTERLESAQYATGKMDNSAPVTLLPPDIDQYRKQGRHNDGANFLASDGHTLWTTGGRISAGGNALTATGKQSRTGCEYHGLGAGNFPCAEGTVETQHLLTFSIQ